MNYNSYTGQRKPSRLYTGIWMLLVVGFGVASVYVVTEAVSRATNFFEPVTYERVETVTYEGPKPEPESYYLINNPKQPNVNAKSYLVADLETGQILLVRGSKIVYPIASITKLMTALAAKDLYDLSETVTLTREALETPGFRGQFSVGQQLSVGEILYPLFLVSSNDAGEALALHKDRGTFIARMNTRALEMGMKSTAFKDPTGLSAGNTSTAEDLFILLQHLYYEEPAILAMSATDYYSHEKQVWRNQSGLRHEETFAGGKTGYTDSALQTSAGIYEITLEGGNTRNLGIIILKSPTRSTDIRNIITYIENALYYGTESSLKSLPE